MFRFLRFFAGAAIAATLLAVPFMISSAGISTNTVSVIVEFSDDPGAVYVAKLKRSGALPSSFTPFFDTTEIGTFVPSRATAHTRRAWYCVGS